MMNQALPMGIGAGSPVSCLPWPHHHGARASLGTCLVPAAVLLSLLPAGPGMGCLCVHRVVLMETNSWGLWDKFFRWLMGRCLGFSLFLFLLIVGTDCQSPQQNWLSVTPSQKHWYCACCSSGCLVTLTIVYPGMADLAIQTNAH